MPAFYVFMIFIHGTINHFYHYRQCWTVLFEQQSVFPAWAVKHWPLGREQQTGLLLLCSGNSILQSCNKHAVTTSNDTSQTTSDKHCSNVEVNKIFNSAISLQSTWHWTQVSCLLKAGPRAAPSGWTETVTTLVCKDLCVKTGGFGSFSRKQKTVPCMPHMIYVCTDMY